MDRGRRYWHRITDLRDPQQESDFAASKEVYEELFEAEYRERHETFREYIGWMPTPGGPTEFYLVAKWEREVVGMAFLTIYEDRYAFISYAGVSRRRVQGVAYGLVAAGMFGALRELLSGYRARAAIYEVEKVDLEELSRSDVVITEQRRDALVSRIQTTLEFQKFDAWTIPLIDYRQPKLGDDDGSRETAMHLMYLPVARASLAPPTLSRADVDDVLRFIYETVYRDGFDQTRNYLRGAREYTIAYLRRLRRNAIKGYPASAALIKIRPGMFISYQSSDLTLVRALERELQAAGYKVWYSGRDSRRYIGHPVWDVIAHHMDVMPLTLFLLTRHYRRKATDYGQDRELAYAHGRGDAPEGRRRRLFYLVERGAPTKLFRDIDRTQIFTTFSRRRFRSFARSFVDDVNHASRDIPLFDLRDDGIDSHSGPRRLSSITRDSESSVRSDVT